MFKIPKIKMMDVLWYVGIVFSIVCVIPIFVGMSIFIIAIFFSLTFPSFGEYLLSVTNNIYWWWCNIINYPTGPENTPLFGWIVSFWIIYFIPVCILEHTGKKEI